MKYVPSAMIGQLSRSAGSTTASRNRFGSYFRNRVMPVNPNTPAQSTVRNQWQELSGAYRDLDEAGRNAWKELGEQMFRTDSLGQTYTLTGLQAYMSINQNLFLIGASTTNVAPTLDVPATLSSITLTATAP